MRKDPLFYSHAYHMYSNIPTFYCIRSFWSAYKRCGFALISRSTGHLLVPMQRRCWLHVLPLVFTSYCLWTLVLFILYFCLIVVFSPYMDVLLKVFFSKTQSASFHRILQKVYSRRSTLICTFIIQNQTVDICIYLLSTLFISMWAQIIIVIL